MILGKDILMDALKPFPDLHQEMEKEAIRRKRNYLKRSEIYSREFMINRNLGKSLAVSKESEGKDEVDNKAQNIRFFNSIKNSLSQKAQKLVKSKKPGFGILMEKLVGLEKKILDLRQRIDKSELVNNYVV